MKLAERLLAELPENTRTIIKQHVRDEALEEAAKVAEDWGDELDGEGFAGKIRALKSGQ